MRQLASFTQISGFAPHSHIALPLFVVRASCGFPSAADDYIEQHIDLNEYCVLRPAATIMVIATGESMIGAGIFPGDLLIVDMAEEPKNGKIVVAALDGNYTVKRLRRSRDKVWLVADNPAYAPIVVGPEQDFSVLGVVIGVIRTLR